MPGSVVWMFSVGLLVLGAGFASSQSYPNKPIRIVTIEAGGGGDLAARLIAQGLSGSLGQQVLVDNRGGGVIAIEIVAKAPPDGYTLLLYGGTLWIGPLLQKVSWDPVRDFSPITLAVTFPNIVAVHPSMPVKSVKELTALAKARPGELNYGSGSIGASTHLAAELFKSMAGVNIVRVPYKGGGPATIALVTGEVQLMFATVGLVTPHVKSGRLRALAVTTAQPSALAPGLPTVAASGVPGYESASILGILAPAKTPEGIINRLNQEIVRALHRPEVKERLFSSGVETVGSSPVELAATMRAESAKWGKVVKEAGIRAE
jgi:tripartite-type tricarboxylate transporter receptor subunit TctC